MHKETESRLLAAQALMAREKLDLLILAPSSNLRYLTGIGNKPDERLQLVLLPAGGEPILLLPEMYRHTQGLVPAAWEVHYLVDGVSPGDTLSAVLSRPLKRVAVEETMRASHLMQLLPHLQGVALAGTGPVMGALRLQKSQEELAAIRSACRLVDWAAGEILPAITEGITERQLAFTLERLCREKGAEGMAFSVNISFGANAANPHHRPDDTVLTRNTSVLMDFGAILNGYCSDITRTVCFGQADEALRNVYHTVLAANRAGLAAARPGLPCQEVDRAARAVITTAGWGENFIHRTGHGLGLDAHEPPYMVEGNGQLLDTGMVFSVEPGIYLPGQLGVRIEDLVAITPTGAECLNERTRELIELS